MVDAALADSIATVVRPGADGFVQSDVWDIALDAMATFERDESFVNLAGDWTFWRAGNPYGVRSRSSPLRARHRAGGQHRGDVDEDELRSTSRSAVGSFDDGDTYGTAASHLSCICAFTIVQPARRSCEAFAPVSGDPHSADAHASASSHAGGRSPSCGSFVSSSRISYVIYTYAKYPSRILQQSIVLSDESSSSAIDTRSTGQVSRSWRSSNGARPADPISAELPQEDV
jgi:hypothetical protein